MRTPRRGGFGDRRKARLEDLATLTGGRAIAEDLGIKIEDLGKARKAPIDKDNKETAGRSTDGGQARGAGHAGSGTPKS